ncbi:MAG: hypothetical protein NVS3B24_14680 [Candidatus Dormibacteria bacterium]
MTIPVTRALTAQNANLTAIRSPAITALRVSAYIAIGPAVIYVLLAIQRTAWMTVKRLVWAATMASRKGAGAGGLATDPTRLSGRRLRLVTGGLGIPARTMSSHREDKFTSLHGDRHDVLRRG